MDKLLDYLTMIEQLLNAEVITLEEYYKIKDRIITKMIIYRKYRRF